MEGHKQTWFLVNSGTVKGKSKGRQAIQILLNSLRNDASFLCFLHKLITMKKNSKAETTIGCWVPVFMRICEQDHQDLIYQKLEIAIWVGSSIRSDKLGIKHLFWIKSILKYSNTVDLISFTDRKDGAKGMGCWCIQ